MTEQASQTALRKAICQSFTIHKKYKFLVELNGVRFGFAKCSKLALRLEADGVLRPEPITLERSARNGEEQGSGLELWAWVTAQSQSPIEPQVAILQMSGRGALVRRWVLNRASLVGFVAGEWDHSEENNVTESVTFSFASFGPA